MRLLWSYKNCDKDHNYFMLSWVNFFYSLFWIFFFSILFNLNNFFTLLFNAEILWVLLYALAGLLGVIVDDASLMSLTFFILGFAAIEISVGLLLLIFMKYNNLSLNFSDNYDYAIKNFGKLLFLGSSHAKKY